MNEGLSREFYRFTYDHRQDHQKLLGMIARLHERLKMISDMHEKTLVMMRDHDHLLHEYVLADVEVDLSSPKDLLLPGKRYL